MATQWIDLVEINTEVENHQTEDTKRGILYDGTKVLNEPKAMESYNEHLDVEGDVIKTELKVERGDDSELETVVYNRIIAGNDVLIIGKTAKSVEHFTFAGFVPPRIS